MPKLQLASSAQHANGCGNNSNEGFLELDCLIIPDRLGDGLPQSRFRKFEGLCTSERHRDTSATQDKGNSSTGSWSGVSKKAEALRFHKPSRTVHTLNLLAAGTKKIIIPTINGTTPNPMPFSHHLINYGRSLGEGFPAQSFKSR